MPLFSRWTGLKLYPHWVSFMVMALTYSYLDSLARLESIIRRILRKSLLALNYLYTAHCDSIGSRRQWYQSYRTDIAMITHLIAFI